MTKHKSRDASHKLSKENQGEKHGILQREEQRQEICIDCIKTLR